MNVLLITADQWRGDSLGSVGHPHVETPCLDALAADGVAFTRHYSQASPCAPGRASLYTGLYLHHHRVVSNGTPLDARHTNVALELRKLGYRPMLFGYTDVSADPRRLPGEDPELRGTERVLPGMHPALLVNDDAKPWRAYLERKGYRIPSGRFGLYRPKPDYPGAQRRGGTYAPAFFAAEDSNTAFQTDRLIEYLSVDAERPWCAHLSFLSPHPPFVVAEPYHELYDPDDIALPARAESPAIEARQHPFLAHYLYNQQGWDLYAGFEAKRNLELDDLNVRQAKATYYAMMSEVDANIGRLVAHLKASGVYDDTLIVFTSDHGEQLGEHWAWAKYCYFDASFHIPLIVRDPRPRSDATRGSRIERFTENVDVMPTLLDLLGAEIPLQCDGESLRPLLAGEPPASWREEAHWELDFRYFSESGASPILGLAPDQCCLSVVRGERYKYVHFTALPPLFFDLAEDPDEFHDCAAEPGYQSRVLELAQKALSWRMNHDERVLANVLLTEDGRREFRGPRR